MILNFREIKVMVSFQLHFADRSNPIYSCRECPKWH